MSLFSLALLFFWTGLGAPQSAPGSPSIQASHPEDWTSPDTLTAALYRLVSGPAGERREWKRFRDLFRADARLVNVDGTAETPVFHEWSVDDYVEILGRAFLDRGVWEREATTVSVGGSHAWSGKEKVGTHPFPAFTFRRLRLSVETPGYRFVVSPRPGASTDGARSHDRASAGPSFP